jgi:hypothetical protein
MDDSLLYGVVVSLEGTLFHMRLTKVVMRYEMTPQDMFLEVGNTYNDYVRNWTLDKPLKKVVFEL